MGRYILKRLLQGIPTFFGVTIISFLMMQAAPGDPVALITFAPNANPETAATLRRQLGLDQPPLLQYVYWLVGNDWTLVDMDGDGVGETAGPRKGLLRGDLGQSLQQKRPVLDLIVERIPATLQLTVSALLVGYGVGVVLGVVAAVYRSSGAHHLGDRQRHPGLLARPAADYCVQRAVGRAAHERDARHHQPGL